MDRIFKIGLLSLEWQSGSLAPINTPIFLKNSHEENKNTLNKKPLNSSHWIQPKQHIHSWSGSEIVVKQIFNLDHRFYILQKYVVCKSRV